MSDAKPLSREERIAQMAREVPGWPNDGCRCDPPYSGEEWCVGTCAAEARAEAERERAERLLGEMALALRDFQRGDGEKAHDRLRSALAPDLMYALKLSLIGVPDDQRRAAQGEGT